MRQHAVAGSIAALGLGLAMTAVPAVATAPIVVVDQDTAIDCMGMVDGRELIVTGYFDASNQSFGGDAEFHDGQTLIWGNVEQTSTWDGSAFRLDATFIYGNPQEESVALASGEPGTAAGALTVEGTATPAGDPLVVDERGRDGNVQWSVTGTITFLAGPAAVTQASGDEVVTVALGATLACSVRVKDLTYRSTNPASFVAQSAWYQAKCALPGEEPESFFGLDGSKEGAYGYLGLGFAWQDEEFTADLAADGPLTRRGRAISGTLTVQIPEDQAGEPVVVDLRIGDLLDRTTYRSASPTYRFKDVVTQRALSGTVLLPGGRVIEVADCVLEEIRSLFRYTPGAGQKPGGKAPANDLPSGAVPIAAGQTLEQSTRGADVAPEAGCTITVDEGSYDVPFGRTIWYSFVGTGGDVDLSSAGSGFDTVMGVYRADGLEQVACVDDVWSGEEGSLEAELTLPTEESVEYLVQVGGFGYTDEEGPQWGDMRVTRN